MEQDERIIPINIEDEMKAAYIDYSMSVIVSRALPDVRDGLKPVHRRVLYGMTELGLAPNRPYKKSARIVGEVLGKYHPHGDSSVYDTMVRLAQPWNMRYTMVDGQGNFGSVDGDNPAAMRYTEARLTRHAEEMLADIDKNTVDFRPNFDDSLTEPTVLPSKLPNLLINGASGIAVGMATNMPPHNLTEVINGILAYIDDREITIEELCKYVKAPDFPTGGIIFGYSGVRQAFETGRGRIVIRGRAAIEAVGKKERIIVTEIPFQVNKSTMISRIADLVNEKVIEGITEIRDESDRTGMRVVFELNQNADAQVVLNKLYKHSALQSTFSVNNIALVDGRPILLDLKSLIVHYVAHRHEVVVRRTQYELAEAEKRAHILEGLLIAIDHLDEVISLIRGSLTPDIAREGLIARFALSEIQAKAILDLRLQRLTGLERDKIKAEYDALQEQIAYFLRILNEEPLRYSIIKEELTTVRDKYGDARRSEIVYQADDLSIEDIIPEEDVVITISHLGYIKRTSLRDYKVQSRGGRGSMGAGSRDEDFIEHLFVANSHSYLMLFTELGKCHWIRVFDIPEGNKTTKGRAIQNVISIDLKDKVRAYIAVRNLKDEEYLQNHYILFCTRKGVIKKTRLASYSRIRKLGIIAINIDPDDQLMDATLTSDKGNVVIATRYGQAIRFEERRVRPTGRNSMGVRAVRLNVEAGDDEVIGMIVMDQPDQTVLVLSEKGYGKRSEIEDYRVTNRGGKGVRTISVTEKTGKLVAISNVKDSNDLMIITKSGIMIRTSVRDIRTMGRAAQGVRVINLKENDFIASITKAEELIEDAENLTDVEAEVLESEGITPPTIIDTTTDDQTEEDLNTEENDEE